MEGKTSYFWHCNYRYKRELAKKAYTISVNVKFHLPNEIAYGHLMPELVSHNSISRKRNPFSEFIVCSELSSETKKSLF